MNRKPARAADRHTAIALAPAKGGAGEEAHLEQRLATAQLVEHQRGEAPQRESQQDRDLDRAEADSSALDDRVGEPGQSRDHEYLAPRVDAPGSRGSRLG